MQKQSRLALTVASIAVGTSLALAPATAETDSKVVSGYADSSATVDPSTIGDELNSLTISLPKENPFDEVEEGELPPDALNNYKFTLKRIAGVDVRTSAGYEKALKLTPLDATRLGFTDPVQVKVSDDSGEVTFNNLPAGLYFIEVEAPPRAGVKKKHIRPLLVVLPATDRDGKWIHEISVSAKTDESGGRIVPPTEIPDPRPSTTPPRPDSTPTTLAPPPQMTTGSNVPPDQSDNKQSSNTPSHSVPGQLAHTGASVLGLTAIAAVLILAGVLLARRKTEVSSNE